MKNFRTYLSLIFLFVAGTGFAQSTACETVAKPCSKHIVTPFVSDGQTYRAFLLTDQTAEFTTTFYGGTTYRVAACSGMTDGNLIFKIKDKDMNLLFTNEDQKSAPYWDFKIVNTIECIIEAQLNPNSSSQSGCAVLLIGFKNK